MDILDNHYITGQTPRKFAQVTSPDNYQRYKDIRTQRDLLRDAQLLKVPRQRTIDPDQVAQGALGVLGAVSAVAPVVAPVAAAAGIGYGVYRLGHSFDLW